MEKFPNTDEVAPPRLATGIAGLDVVLHGGLLANRLYLLEGIPGTGKTTLALQFLLEGVRRGEPVLYVTLSETKEELTDGARSHGWSLAGLDIHELVAPEEGLRAESQYTIFHPSEVELGDLTQAVLDEVLRLRPRRVVFDSLSEMRLMARDALRYRRQILALKQFFVGRQCTVLLLDDRTATDADLQVQSIAHGVVLLEQVSIGYGVDRRRLSVRKLRGSSFRGGYHDLTIKEGGIEVYPRLSAVRLRGDFEPGVASSGLPGLDAQLGGGLDRGTSTLVMGPAGSGKSSVVAQFAAAAAGRGERVAAFLFDEVVNLYFGRAAGLGIDLRSQVEAGRLSVRQVAPAELSPGEFANFVQEAVERDGARVVIIDSLNGYLQAMPDERFLSVHMHELLSYLNQQGVLTLVVMAQHNFLGPAMSAPVDVSYLADTVMLLRYFEARGAIRRAISVVKKRSGHHEDTIRELRFSPAGIEVGRPLTEFQGVLTGVPLYTGEPAEKELKSGRGDERG